MRRSNAGDDAEALDEQLVEALEERDAGRVRDLIARGAPVNDDHRPPLTLAAQMGDIACIELLIAAGAKLDGGGRNVPLSFAAKAGHAEAIRVLAAAGADVNAWGITRETALHVAVAAGHRAAAEALIRAGADVNAKVSNPRPADDSPAGAALRHGQFELADLLVSHGARDEHMGAIRLTRAAQWGRLAEVRGAIEGGLAPDTRDPGRHTALGRAAGAGHVDVVRYLLDRGADPNGVSGKSHTPVMSAAENGHLETVRLLVERGADPARSTIPGEKFDALHVAQGRGHKDVIKYLKANMGKKR